MSPNDRMSPEVAALPLIRNVGLTGMLVTFGDQLTDEANLAALAFRDAVEDAGIEGVMETSTSPVSTFVLFDPSRLPRETLKTRLRDLIATTDRSAMRRPASARLWRIKVSFGGDHAPHLPEVAELVGLSPEGALNQILETRVRVITIGFAPGQPYLGTLPPNWDFPRLPELTPQVPRVPWSSRCDNWSCSPMTRRPVGARSDKPPFAISTRTAIHPFGCKPETRSNSSGSTRRKYSAVLPTRRAMMPPNSLASPDACTPDSSRGPGSDHSGPRPPGMARIRRVAWRSSGSRGAT